MSGEVPGDGGDGREARAGRAVPAPALFLGAGASMYYGAALAVGLFAVADAVSVGWARLAVAGLVLLALTRPWALTWTRHRLAVAALFGLVLGAMNLLFYVAIDHLPLGAAVAIEFIGPVVVAVLAAGASVSLWRRIVPPLLAAGGVAAISAGELDWSGMGAGSGVGVLFALAAGAAWAGYMVLGRRIAARAAAEQLPRAPREGGALRAGMASLALGMTTASIAYAVIGAPGAVPLAGSWSTLALIAGVAVLSSVVPYALDQVAMQRLTTSQFALLNALLPATAVLVGLVTLGQVPTAWELVGVGAISVAVAVATRPSR